MTLALDPGRLHPRRMQEHSTNILRELRPWNFLVARCSRCGRQGEVQRRFLGDARTLAEIQQRLRCCRCQNRELNQITITNASR